ncbi:MAG TPA: response regulator [Bryobacteraceae bacterium]|jgi:CheY-like chemotaxis protein
MTERVTVLLVDDAEDCLDTLDVALQTLPGVEVRAAHSAEAAWELMARDHVAAVITDIHLPRMTGLELISRIRREPKWRALPILVVSADADPAAPRTALDSGANAYFSKPFSPGAVRKKLEELMHG